MYSKDVVEDVAWGVMLTFSLSDDVVGSDAAKLQCDIDVPRWFQNISDVNEDSRLRRIVSGNPVYTVYQAGKKIFTEGLC